MLEPVGFAVPLERVAAIQFGLPTTKEILAASVFEKRQSIERQQQLLDARLGLPAPGDCCTSCGAASLEHCDGHFGHITLPTPIFHPSHVSSLCKLLQKLCLNCCRLKKKLKSKDKNVQDEQKAGNFFDDVKNVIPDDRSNEPSKPPIRKKKVSREEGPEEPGKSSEIADVVGRNSGSADVVLFATSLIEPSSRILQSSTRGVISRVKKERVEMNGYVVLSDDEVDVDDGDAVIETRHRQKRSGKQSRDLTPTKHPVIDLGSDDDDDLKLSGDTVQAERSQFAAPGRPSSLRISSCLGSTKVRETRGREQQFKGQQTETSCRKTQPHAQQKAADCKYCMRSKDGEFKYPGVRLKLVSKFIRNDECIQSIQMEISRKGEEIPPDYWSFLGDHFKSPAEEKSGVRSLLPIEALQILRKISEEAINRLGMDNMVARPEAFILECIPVPPNCIRLSENMIHNASSASKVGTDPETQILRSLLKKIASIKGARTGKPTYRAILIEFEQLQYLFSQYLRVKGAPKVAGNSEPMVIRSYFVSSKTYSSKWLNQLRGTVLGKSSNFSARNILTGDPCIEIDEIAIPWELAENITIPEKVTLRNKENLQHYLDNAPVGIPSCGPLIIEQGGRAFDISMAKHRRLLEVGDSVHRRLRDGDRVFANRPPTLDRHALICLRVKLQTHNTFAINPILCAPYNADFDGDALHLYIPQSIEARLETRELMAVESQFTCSQGGQAIISVTQDALLGAYLLTTGHTFFTRSQIGQILMCESFLNKISLPAILKSPKGAFWTGKQVFSVTLPVGLDYSSPDSTGVFIKDGEILKSDEGSQWLKNQPDSLVCAISRHVGPSGALKHLNLVSKISQEWLLMQGFSVGLLDFCIGDHVEVRASMVKEAVQEAKLHISGQWKLINMLNLKVEPTSTKGFLNLVVASFHEYFLKVEKRLLDLMGRDNSLSAILKAGSKGSAAKLRQQVCCVGIQLHRGKQFIRLNQEETLSLSQVVSTSYPFHASESKEMKIPGLIESSYLDGLSPIEFFFSSISSREAAVKQGIDIRQPGVLFKNLMLFLRDIHSSYDGTVRYNYNQQLIQFKYGGSKARGRFRLLKTKCGLIQRYKMEEDAHIRWRDSNMAGEAVGVLAATAIVQPAYQMLLDPPQQTDLRRSSPLEILQDSLLTRYSSSLKDIDRTVILRVKQCGGQKSPHWREWNVLKVQDHLKKITLEMLTQCVVIEFLEKHKFGEWNENLRRKSPWLCHIQLKEDALRHFKITTDAIISCLKKTVNDKRTLCKWDPSVQPIIFCRNSCHLRVSSNMEIGGPCIHVMYDIYDECFLDGEDTHVLELLTSIRDRGVPYLMTTTVKGESWVDSVDVVWEEKDHPLTLATDVLPRNRFKNQISRNGELVVVVTVDKAHCKKRGLAWSSIIMACTPILDLLDLRRSTPASIQEIRHTLGIEAAHQSILKRISLALKTMGNPVHDSHLKLVADLMVHSGDVIGFTAGGLKEFSRNISMSAPFLQGSFQAPFKTFLNAAGRGARDDLHGVVPSSVWGKPSAVGTGGHFDLLWNLDKSADHRSFVKQLDIHELVACFKTEMDESRSIPADQDFMPEVYPHQYLDEEPESMERFSPPPRAIPDSPTSGAVICTEDAICNDSLNVGSNTKVDTLYDNGWGASSDVNTEMNGYVSLNSIVSEKKLEAGSTWVEKTGSQRNGWGEITNECGQDDSVEDWPMAVDLPNDNPEVDRSWNKDGNDLSKSLYSKERLLNKAITGIMKNSQSGSFNQKPQGLAVSWDEPPQPQESLSLEKQSAMNADDQVLMHGYTNENELNDGKSADYNEDNGKKRNKKVFTPTGANLVPLQPRPTKEQSVTAANAADKRITGLSNDSRVVDAFVKTVKHILHYRYEPGQSLGEDDAKLVLEQLLPYHPDCHLKLGCGADAIKVDYNPSYPSTRCFFVVRKDGTVADFSYHKCVRGYLEKNFPSYLEEYDTLYRLRKPEEDLS
ncbi:hypothetical protein O6H91_22G055100 [Diphasiastrum complanatum]|nr:hypothetical protein O6H91_22G055100 [Diphasiastrum complanatum]KAJ7516350.1 hypothetical protein O6H91_22G055100 [Diphasiastrum complanatum]KAJ7516351.1 hypothetical protein O6H91_22G055100 [Diphasiastrum complanatum]KAJ7516354.1 hypothetical protein O6H91_22G055100 [Diphasiastrum complanatum]KAJ7516356.1 hypothetical protein O6H91_22G055100 [Diphasiastrum complanatum]